MFPADGLVEQLDSFPPGAFIGITCSPSRGIGATLRLVEKLRSQEFNLVPHIAARQIRDVAHLRDVLDELEGHGIRSVFVPGGDIRQPAGEFESALSVLRAMAEIGHRMTNIGVAAHPEGHPFIDSGTLILALQEKQAFATYLVTQMCFDSRRVLDWLDGIRSRGIGLEAWVGLPGVIERSKLFDTALRIGVGESARFALRQKTLARRLVKRRRYDPEDLLLDLAGHMGDERLNIGGFYVFSFNQIASTLAWRAEMLERLV